MSTIHRKNGRFISAKRANSELRRTEAAKKRLEKILENKQKQKAMDDASMGMSLTDLGLMTKLMVCEGCNQLLYLAHMMKREKFGMAELVHIKCMNCNRTRAVPTSDYRVGTNGNWIFKINEEMASGTYFFVKTIKQNFKNFTIFFLQEKPLLMQETRRNVSGCRG